MKLSLRDLFWATVLAALSIAWWIDHARLAETIRREREEVVLRKLEEMRAQMTNSAHQPPP